MHSYGRVLPTKLTEALSRSAPVIRWVRQYLLDDLADPERRPSFHEVMA